MKAAFNELLKKVMLVLVPKLLFLSLTWLSLPESIDEAIVSIVK